MKSTAQQHVVLIDDSRLNLRTQAMLLERLPNVKTHAFSSSAEALAWSDLNDADCFIIDFRMPAPDGIEVTRILRERVATKLTPIIMVTGDSDRSSRYAALDAGVNDFVEKPVDPREFVARIATFLALHDARKHLDARVGDLTVSLSNEERRTRDHAARLEALCGITTNPQLNDDEMLSAILTQSAGAVRPGEHFYAALFRIDGAEAVLVAVGERRMRFGVASRDLGGRVTFGRNDSRPARATAAPRSLGTTWRSSPTWPPTHGCASFRFAASCSLRCAPAASTTCSSTTRTNRCNGRSTQTTFVRFDRRRHFCRRVISRAGNPNASSTNRVTTR